MLVFTTILSFLVFPSAWAAKKKIVLFYIGAAPSGKVVANGHTAACEAAKKQIEEECARLHIDPSEVEIELKNINDFSRLPSEEIVRREEEYIKLIKTEPERYNSLYNASKSTRAKLDPLLVETEMDLEKLGQYLEGNGDPSKKVNVAIGAHWLVPLAIAQIKSTGKAPQLKSGWMFTDYYENPLFPEISKCSDMTFLGSNRLVDQYQQAGVAPSNAVSSGIPISPYASVLSDRDSFLKRKGMDTSKDVVTIALAGGGEGLGDFPTIVRSIRDRFRGTGKKVQLVAITAKNEEHFRNLTELNKQWKAEGDDSSFTLKIEKSLPNEEMLDYVKSSDLYIVKSGGLSPTEGAVIGKPMILLDVLGGHERDNGRFYEKIGIGQVNRDPQVIGDQAFSLLQDPNKLKKMKEDQAEFRSHRDFKKVAQFALSETPTSFRGCWDANRSDQGKELVRSIGLGPRSERSYLVKGREHLAKATEARKSGDSAGAASSLKMSEKFFHQALVINPDDSAAHFMLAHVHHTRGDTAKALEEINKSIGFDFANGHDGQYFHRGLYKVDQGELRGGMDDLLRALAIEKKHQNGDYSGLREKVKEVLIGLLDKDIDESNAVKREAVYNALLKIDQGPSAYSPYYAYSPYFGYSPYIAHAAAVSTPSLDRRPARKPDAWLEKSRDEFERYYGDGCVDRKTNFDRSLAQEVDNICNHILLPQKAIECGVLKNGKFDKKLGTVQLKSGQEWGRGRQEKRGGIVDDDVRDFLKKLFAKSSSQWRTLSRLSFKVIAVPINGETKYLVRDHSKNGVVVKNPGRRTSRVKSDGVILEDGSQITFAGKTLHCREVERLD